MKRVKKLAVYDPKEFAMREKGDVPYHNEVSIVDINILPLTDVLITT